MIDPVKENQRLPARLRIGQSEAQQIEIGTDPARTPRDREDRQEAIIKFGFKMIGERWTRD
ncbi:MAG: hypothetical protein KGR68_19095 [Betaproteobacteria bacterium]|nr:hypothetical protein [Betaproteobacteria bacterium]